MLGEEGAQQILGSMAQQHPAIAGHLQRSLRVAEPAKEDAQLLNIEKA
jgi:hypothetical protein